MQLTFKERSQIHDNLLFCSKAIRGAYRNNSRKMQLKTEASTLNVEILYGDEEGIEEMCEGMIFVHVSSINKNQYGTPTLDYIFKNVPRYHKKQNSLLYKY